MADMAGTFYISYLVLLLLLPVVVRWRWGLVAALAAAVAELAVIALVFHLVNAYHVFPDQFAGEPPLRAPMEIMRRRYERSAVAWVHLVALVGVPAAAALIGAAMAVVWSVAVAIRRTSTDR
jgi:uncharacterized membrane protein